MTSKYGVHTEEVVALIDRLKTLTYEEAEALQSASEVFPDAYRYSAQCAAERAVMQFAQSDNFRAARLDVLSYVYDEAREAPWHGLRHVVIDAALDYILTLFASGLITPGQYSILYTPWATVMKGGR